MHRQPLRSVLPAACLFLLACSTGTEPLADERMAIIDWPDRETETTARTLEADLVATVGATFPVTIRTWGPNHCWQPGHEDIEQSTYTVEIVPFDGRSADRTDCGSDPVRLERTVDLTFHQRPARIRIIVRGRTVAEGDDPLTAAGETTVERFVEIP